MGEKLSFFLSLGLFSSFGVDSGTRLLLKTLAQQKIIPENGRILDAGCGTGVIAVSLKKRFPDASVTAADRDALALNFTAMNAKLNGVAGEGFSTAAGLLPGSIRRSIEAEPLGYDLIVSNIPAKAGNPVIKDFLQNCGRHLSEEGIAAAVIVEPLAEFAAACLEESGSAVLFREDGPQYSVFHFRPAASDRESSFSDIYERTSGSISGIYGLPEFDTASYATRVCREMLEMYSCGGRTLVWNPGIGHIPASCKSAFELIIAGTDLLQLKASDYNVTAGAVHLHLPRFSALENAVEGNLTYIVAVPDFISGASVESEIILTARKLLKEKGKLLVAGRSSDISRLEKVKQDFTTRHSIKFRGFRAILLENRRIGSEI